MVRDGLLQYQKKGFVIPVSPDDDTGDDGDNAGAATAAALVQLVSRRRKAAMKTLKEMDVLDMVHEELGGPGKRERDSQAWNTGDRADGTGVVLTKRGYVEK